MAKSKRNPSAETQPQNDLVRAAVLRALRRGVLIGAYCTTLMSLPAVGAELPVSCVAGTCGSFVTSGNATSSVLGNTLNINQTTENAILNWQSFNVSEDGTVNFVQPSASSTALNRIYQADPSRIFGALNANGRVFLINRNGIVFGEGSRVNVGGLIASSLNISPEALETGIVSAARSNRPAFEQFVDANGRPVSSGAIEVQRGAQISSVGGQVLMFAPEVRNFGTIRTPDGQTILAAGQSVFLTTSDDPNLRGLLVEVDVGGTATNGDEGPNAGIEDPSRYIGQIIAERGNVTLAGLSVNQNGRISASTSVKANGSVRLQAREGVMVSTIEDTRPPQLIPTGRRGNLTFGKESVTEIQLDLADPTTDVAVNEQLRSRVDMFAKNVQIGASSRVVAAAGNITVDANDTVDPQSSRIYVADGAILDVSGASVSAPIESNVVRVELRASQVANSPEQRDGALRGETVFVDVRRSGVRADGTPWQGTPLADVSGDIATVRRTVGERNVNGGSVTLASQGSVLVSEGALIDISGGQIAYRDGFIRTSRLVSKGRAYDIGDADPRRRYGAVLNPDDDGVFVVEHEKWGITETFQNLVANPRGSFEQGYIEGKDAGQLSIIAPQIVLDGRIDGSVVTGRLQRQPTQSLSRGSERPFDQVALRGRATFGRSAQAAGQRPDYEIESALIAAGSVLPTLRNADGSQFNPSTDPVPTDTAFRFRPELLSESGVGEVAIFANDRITLPQDVMLTGPDGGSVTLTAAEVRIEGTIDMPAGTINLTSLDTVTTNLETAAAGKVPGLFLGPTTRLSAAGRWVNDSPLVNAPGAALAPLWIDGGEIDIEAQSGDAMLSPGSVLDVSGGARLRANGELDAGRGGSVTLEASRDNFMPATLQLGGEIRGHSFGKGGELSITANAICIASFDCTGGQDNVLQIAPTLLETSGFGSYSLGTNLDGLMLAADTRLRLQQVSLALPESAAMSQSSASARPTSRNLPTSIDKVVLREDLRAPVHLALKAKVDRPNNTLTNAIFASTPGLTTAEGSVIEGDIGAQISLASNTFMTVAGTVSAPAGAIDLSLSSDLSPLEFLDGQAIRLGETASLLARGAAIVRADDTGRRQGDVVGGGRVSVTATDGYILTAQGSRIDVSGTAAQLDLPVTALGATTAATDIASDGGRIAFSALEGMFLQGGIQGRAGAGAGAQGGELSIALSSDPARANNQIFPLNARAIELRATPSDVIVAPGMTVPRNLNGLASIDTRLIDSGGFDSLALTARDLFGLRLGNPVTSPGSIRFDGDVTLEMGRRIVLDAASIEGVSGTLNVRAPYVAFGNTSDDPRGGPHTAVRSGEGTLRIDAGLIDVIGSSALQGLERVQLTSTGDVRLRGIQLDLAEEITGSLVAAADVDIEAAQLYATTLSKFTIDLRAPDSRLRVTSPGTEAADTPLLSAASQLTLKAPRIEQAGIIRAPFGSIALNADEVVLEAGSVTSAAGANALVPFGQTQGGFDLVYPIDRFTFVFDRNSVPQKQVSLAGASIDVRAGATIDVSGGGDLLATEFVPGVGGTRDVLNNTVRPNQFAILPGSGMEYAPFDPLLANGSTLSAGASIYLEGMEGLPAGEYALLPAGYALLPGAFLVTLTDGYRDIVPGQQFRQLDGSVVVAGRRTVAGTNLTAARYDGFAVRRGQDVLREAQYTSTLANEFYADQAARDGVAAPRLSKDAGLLALNATTQLRLDGDLIAAGVDGGRGAGVDISGVFLRVSGNSPPIGVPSAGEVVLDAASLTRLGAESLLLGGRRSQTDDGLSLAVTADRVTFNAGAELTIPELLAVATGAVTVESGARLSISAGAVNVTDQKLLVAGDGALLRLSAGEQSTLERTAEKGARGTLDIRSGAVLSAPGGSIILDASRDTLSRGRLEAPGGSLNLAASRISLGAVDAVSEGLALSTTDLESLGVAELVLTSRSTVDLYGDFSVSFNDLVIEAAGLRGRGNSNARLAATQSIELGNRNAVGLSGDEADGGTLQLTTAELRLGAGDFVLDGFANTRLEGSRDIRSLDDGTTRVSGAAELVSGGLSSAPGGNRKVIADGALLTTAVAPRDAAGAPGLGGDLLLSGTSVRHAGRIDLPAGVLRLEATGTSSTDGVVLASGSSVNLRGASTDFDGVSVAARGGRVQLAARSGDVVVEQNAIIDVAGAAQGGDAGSLDVFAPNGTADMQGQLLATTAEGFRGGSFAVDAGNIVGFGALNTRLNEAGFTLERGLRQRNEGSLAIAADETIQAHRVTVTADRGGISVDGSIDARGASGGKIYLNARDDLAIGGALLANANTDTGDGGEIRLSTVSGGLSMMSSARLDVSKGAGTADVMPTAGEISLRLPRESLLSLVDGDALNDRLSLQGNIAGAKRVRIEGYRSYERTTIGANEVSTSSELFTDAQAFADNASGILQALGRDTDPAFQVVPGIEVSSPTDLTLDAVWDLYSWRFNGLPGVLALRAGGTLKFAQSLTDGFDSSGGLTDPNAFPSPYLLPETPGESWSYLLIAGADSSSSDTLAVQRKSMDGEELSSGDLIVAAGDFISPAPDQRFNPSDFRMIRTGTGSIDIRVARDLVLGNQASVIYTAGTAGPGIGLINNNESRFELLGYPVNGGDISIAAGGSIQGAPSDQLVTDWLWRVGRPRIDRFDIDSSPTAWTVNFQRFEQGIGALGGGDVTIAAGGDVENLSVSLPVIGRQVGGARVEDNRVEMIGGGDLVLQARGSIRGGNFLVGNGTARIDAGDSISAPQTSLFSSRPLSPLLGLIGPGGYAVSARRDLQIETVFNPTLLPQGSSQNVSAPSVFSTYDPGNRVELLSVAGDVVLRNDINSTAAVFRSMEFPEGSKLALGIYAPALRTTALTRDVRILGPMSLYPAPKGNLELFAERDIVALPDTSGGQVQILVSDTDPNFLPSVAQPQFDYGRIAGVFTSAFGSPNLHAQVPVHADERQSDGRPDLEPVRVIARTGDIVVQPNASGQGSGAGFFVPKAARVVAGGDIRDLTLVSQHLRATDLTIVAAGGDIVYPARRAESGALTQSISEIAVDGPGTLQLAAGGSIDLQTSAGISTRGNLTNPNLPEGGASISVQAGLNDVQPGYDAVTSRYLALGTGFDIDLVAYIEAITGETNLTTEQAQKRFDQLAGYRKNLVAHVEQRTGRQNLSETEALALFRSSPVSEQRVLLEKVFFSELRFSGREAAKTGSSDFSRGFTALETLFPGSNRASDTEPNPYRGDLNLFFSRIYTLNGGDIDVLVPGGLVNVGLATPPAAFGVTKAASELGIVVQSTGSVAAFADGDFAVNESRTFAVDGGDILVWSTNGDIDAGRGAKTAISAPSPTTTFDKDGRPKVTFPAALAGSGIQTLATSLGRKPGNVDLFAPRGVVNAGDAGIVAGNLTIAATAVLGADNIQVSGVSVGVPVDTGGLGASLAGVSSVGASASNAATGSIETDPDDKDKEQKSQADTALSWLEVFIIGLGEETCKQDDIDCLKRQKVGR